MRAHRRDARLSRLEREPPERRTLNPSEESLRKIRQHLDDDLALQAVRLHDPSDDDPVVRRGHARLSPGLRPASR
jgi:hypothetical protein